MTNIAAEISARLAGQTESVCRHYLSSGKRHGRYWLVGDVANNPGKSLFVRLAGPPSGPGAAGRWRDAATGQHGDVLDLIQLTRELPTLSAAMDDARAFLGTASPSEPPRPLMMPRDNAEAARRLFRSAKDLTGTLAQAYLRSRRIDCSLPQHVLRFHPRCYFRPNERAERQSWPALLAAVTDLSGTITGVQRTYLARDGHDKAPFEEPRRALGHLHGHAVRLGRTSNVLAVGEGLETMLSLRTLAPDLPIAAALSSSHLANLILPSGLSRLYIALDDDVAGREAAEHLRARADAAGIAAHLLIPPRDDWNTALQDAGRARCCAQLADQLHRDDTARFLAAATAIDVMA